MSIIQLWYKSLLVYKSHPIFVGDAHGLAMMLRFFFSIQRLERLGKRGGVCQLGIPKKKNIILQFLKCRPNERDHLVPVFSTTLKLSQEEKDQMIQQVLGGFNDASTGLQIISRLPQVKLFGQTYFPRTYPIFGRTNIDANNIGPLNI